MKTIDQQEIEKVKDELAAKRKEFEQAELSNLKEKLEWIRDFFNSYVPELEKRYMTDEELDNWSFLPDELRVYFYIYFPEHGLNMANDSQKLERIIAMQEKKTTINRFHFSHWD